MVMMKTGSVLLLVLLTATSVSAKKKKGPPRRSGPAVVASGQIAAKSGAALRGSLSVREITGTDAHRYRLVVSVDHAPPGEHAVHIHEKGDCSAPDGRSAGAHWNPSNEAHGQWGHSHFHLGDIGNMKVGSDGKGSITIETDKWTPGSGLPSDPMGKAIIVHEKIDDFTTQPTGNAGNRIGCGVIVSYQQEDTENPLAPTKNK